VNFYLPLHTWVYLPAVYMDGRLRLLRRWLDRMWSNKNLPSLFFFFFSPFLILVDIHVRHAHVYKYQPCSAGCFLAYKPAMADLLWEKNIIPRLISRADKLSRTGDHIMSIHNMTIKIRRHRVQLGNI
jgi:hypothetical protein